MVTGIDRDYPRADALLKALYEIMFWTVTGPVVAWRLGRLSNTPRKTITYLSPARVTLLAGLSSGLPHRVH